MAFHGHARVNPRHPRASAVCDRCGSLWNHYALRHQMQWAGSRLVDTHLLVCKTCLDEPSSFMRNYLVDPNDPVPIKDPRPDLNGGYQPDVFTTDDGLTWSMEDGTPIVRENGA